MEKVANGYYTRVLGEKLERLVEAEFRGLYRVYYDHKLTNPDRIITQFGRGEHADDLAHVDVAIVSTRDNEERLCLISEIEEHKHTPKRLLGDIAAIMMADNVKFGGRDHPLTDLMIVLGFVTRKNGQTGPRAKRYLSRFESAMDEGMGGERRIRSIVLNADTAELMVKEVETCIKSLLLEGPNQ